VVEVRLAGMVDLYGAELEFAFDPTMLKVMDDKAGTVGIQISPGGMPDPLQAFVAQNAADNPAGTIAYAVSLLSPSPAANGDGVLARIRFKALAAGESVVSITRASLVSAGSCCIVAGLYNGAVTTIGATGGSVTGRVRLEGRTNYEGATISIADKRTTTAADGTFTISDIPAGTYNISASAPSYLRAEKVGVVVTAGNTTTLPEATLLAGDIDGNCRIEIFDLVLMGSHYGSSPLLDTRGDFNQDGLLNILDLVILGGNYNDTCPTTWQIQ
jgi:hypothetical protein